MTEAAPYETAMRRALALAARGPALGVNPQVGCVLLSPAGDIVAEGWHRGAGTAHAEVDALSHVSHLDMLDGRGATTGLTAVVTLEPCNHIGRTGPCTEALVAAGVTRVVYAVADPGKRSGGGNARLREAGVEVIGGVLSGEVSEFLRPWLIAARLERPFVTVKWASSLDGRAAAADGSSQWITGPESRRNVHEERAHHDAIVIGTGTALADDPELTARGAGGEPLDAQPIPVVIGERAVPATAKLRSHPAGLVETRTRDVAAVLADLYGRGIRRVYVEGGPTVASEFIRLGLVDEYSIYLGPLLLGGPRTVIGDLGIAGIAGARRLDITAVERFGSDVHITARPDTGLDDQASDSNGGK
jgi:diaminohydroxyphosphoribosylaminopyrimidine deaminase/5-amino-6-(5-phosphoribosylamino)uracil reductase